MVFVGVVLVLGAVALALVVAAITLWSGWAAAKDELLPGFKTRPPGAGSLSLMLLGVALPVLVIAAFTIYLAVVLVQLAINAF